MSKIGIVTFFNSINYGVWLQAYATQRALSDLGHNVEMVDYSNEFEGKKLRYTYDEDDRAIGYVTSLLKAIIYGRVRYYKKAFGDHLHEYYNTTLKHYTDINDMKDLEYDVLVAGSDQIWNPEITGGKFDKVYLLQFGKVERRISFASSIGSKPVREEDKDIFREAFKTFHAIGVRENYAKTQLQPLTDLPIKVVCDPTFLLSREKWESLISEKATYKCENEKYILTYFVSPEKRSQRYQDMIKGYHDSMNLPVWSVQFSTYKNNPCEKLIVGATTADFLKLIQNAELVITDSFHGAALSANLNTNFVCIQNRKNPERTKTLFERLDLMDRIDMQPEQYKACDYESVNPRIDEMREEALTWLVDVLKEK